MVRKWFAWILLVICSVLTPVVAQEAIPVRVGTLKQAGLTNVNIAVKEGLFTKYGLAASLIEFRSGNEAIAALQGGSVDIILSSPPFALTANEAGFDLVLSAVRPWAPDVIVQAIASMSFIGHFQRITDGVFDASALVFFFSLIAFALWLNVQILDARKAA
jgi:ABC-type nitrate/sulfonate/bicarbonate transport system substrate-binding protein